LYDRLGKVCIDLPTQTRKSVYHRIAVNRSRENIQSSVDRCAINVVSILFSVEQYKEYGFKVYKSAY